MRASNYWLPIVLVVGLSACANRGPTYGTGEDIPGNTGSATTLAVLGVVARGNPLQGFRRKSLANDLEASLRIYQPKFGIYPHDHLRRDLEKPDFGSGNSNAGVHQLLLNRYKLNGTLTSEDLSLLRSASAALRYILVARIDEDRTIRYQPYASTVRNRKGEVLLDQREMTLLHERSVQVSATTFDLQTGKQIWSGAFASKPVAKRVYTEYVGSSFSGSVASMLANSFVNGRSSKKHPQAPRSVVAIRETFKNIAREMLGNSR